METAGYKSVFSIFKNFRSRIRCTYQFILMKIFWKNHDFSLMKLGMIFKINIERLQNKKTLIKSIFTFYIYCIFILILLYNKNFMYYFP